MRPRLPVYVVVVAAAFGLSTLLTYAFARDNNLVASLLDAAFVIAGVAALEFVAHRRRTRSEAVRGATLTLLFSDVEDSTGLLRTLGERYVGALTRQETLVSELVERHGGTVVDSQGDAVFAAFRLARDAVAAAVAIHAATAAEDWPDEQPVRVRIGVDTGDVTEQQGRYIGFAVHRAARICAVAHGGQTLISDATRALLSHDAASRVDLRDLGEHRLRGLDQPVRLYEVVLRDQAAEPPRQPRPEGHEPFAGREEELATAVRRTVGSE